MIKMFKKKEKKKIEEGAELKAKPAVSKFGGE